MTVITSITESLDRIQTGAWASDRMQAHEIEQTLRHLVADHYLGWPRADVACDIDGENSGWFYRPPNFSDAYVMPPKGSISPYLFVPSWHVLRGIDEVDRFRFHLPIGGMMQVHETPSGYRARFGCVYRGTNGSRIIDSSVGTAHHRQEHVARLLAILYALLESELKHERYTHH